FGELGEAEIENFHVAVRPDHDVFRLDVAMYDARGMRRSQCADDLRRYVEGLADRQFRPRHSPAQRGALDIFGCDEMPALGLADLENSDDVRVVERGRCLGLLLEAAQTFRVLRVAFGKELDCDFAI